MKNLTMYFLKCYLDGGNGVSLGWPANIPPAAALFAQIWNNAGKSPYIRGIATNVAGYNALNSPTTSPTGGYDELHYISALGPLLASNGWNAKFIVDQSRSAIQTVQSGTWCNRKNAGFGPRPTTSTPSSLIDSIVWVKPGGESDGTSNTGSPYYEPACATSDAKVPSPEAGQWFQAYFIDLVNYANPSF
jgi:cellulose 1,4-beta-cellobiosidase